MRNPIKAVIRWWNVPNNRGVIIGIAAFGAMSAAIGYKAGSVWLGIFAVPLLFVAMFIYAAVVISLAMPIYYACVGIGRGWKAIKRWAYTED